MMLQVTSLTSAWGRNIKFISSQTYIQESFYIVNLLDTTDAPVQTDAVQENPPNFQFFSAHNDVEDGCLLSSKILDNQNPILRFLRSWIVRVYS